MNRQFVTFDPISQQRLRSQCFMARTQTLILYLFVVRFIVHENSTRGQFGASRLAECDQHSEKNFGWLIRWRKL